MKLCVFLVFLWIVTVSRGDTEVSCVVMETCILPCSFQEGPDVIVSWTFLGNLRVHTYYNNQDQLEYQGQMFINRTSLFKDQISRGNASLQLTGVKVQDGGTYKCFTRTKNGEKDSFINLKVYDTEVSCVVMETCILPCSFQEGPHVIIHWTHLKGENRSVHKYYEDQDQLQEQHEIYRNRTSLFKDQISRGNASLQLTGVKVQDGGRYECFTNDINGEKDSFIYLQVKVHVGGKKLKMDGTAWTLIAVALMAAAAAAAVVVFLLCYKKKKGQQENNRRRSNSETRCMKPEDRNEGQFSNEENVEPELQSSLVTLEMETKRVQ